MVHQKNKVFCKEEKTPCAHDMEMLRIYPNIHNTGKGKKQARLVLGAAKAMLLDTKTIITSHLL